MRNPKFAPITGSVSPRFAGVATLMRLPIMRALAKNRPVGIVHFDAHTDTWDGYFGGFKYTHAVYAPGTGTPEIGGLTTLEAQRMVRALRGLNIVGGDVVEVSPPFDQSGNTAMVGATMAFEILCVLADSLAGRRAAP